MKTKSCVALVGGLDFQLKGCGKDRKDIHGLVSASGVISAGVRIPVRIFLFEKCMSYKC